jgi:hypothetical protein
MRTGEIANGCPTGIGMLLQTNSYIVPKDKKAEHSRLIRRFRQTLLRLGCDHFEVYEQVGSNWSNGESQSRYVQILRFLDRKHQLAVQAAERTDPTAQAVISDFCELINFPYQQQQGLFAVGFYTSVLPIQPKRGARGEVVSTVEHEVIDDPQAEAPYPGASDGSSSEAPVDETSEPFAENVIEDAEVNEPSETEYQPVGQTIASEEKQEPAASAFDEDEFTVETLESSPAVVDPPQRASAHDDAAFDETPVHEALMGEASVGEASVGEASVGEASVGEASVGEASVGDESSRDVPLQDHNEVQAAPQPHMRIVPAPEAEPGAEVEVAAEELLEPEAELQPEQDLEHAQAPEPQQEMKREHEAKPGSEHAAELDLLEELEPLEELDPLNESNPEEQPDAYQQAGTHHEPDGPVQPEGALVEAPLDATELDDAVLEETELEPETALKADAELEPAELEPEVEAGVEHESLESHLPVTPPPLAPRSSDEEFMRLIDGELTEEDEERAHGFIEGELVDELEQENLDGDELTAQEVQPVPKHKSKNAPSPW